MRSWVVCFWSLECDERQKLCGDNFSGFDGVSRNSAEVTVHDDTYSIYLATYLSTRAGFAPHLPTASPSPITHLPP